jgi:hypothetical protein
MTTAAIFAVVITATTVYVASAISAILNVAAVFTITTAIFTISTATFTISTASTSIASAATATISVYSVSTSDRSPHSVSSVRPSSYHPLAPFPQSVMNT